MEQLDYFQQLYKDKVVAKEDDREAEFNASIIKIGNSHGIIIEKKVLDSLGLKVGGEVTINMWSKEDPEVVKWENELRELLSKSPFTQMEIINFWLYLQEKTGASGGMGVNIIKNERYYQNVSKAKESYLKVRKYLDKHYLNITVDGDLATLFSKLKEKGISQDNFSAFTVAVTSWLAEGRQKELLEYLPKKKDWKKKVRVILETQKILNQ